MKFFVDTAEMAMCTTGFGGDPGEIQFIESGLGEADRIAVHAFGGTK